MKFFWSPQTRSTRVAWLLEETGLEYERVSIDIRNPSGIADPDFHRASPMGKVPAITDGPVAMAESAAIGIYIADRYASKCLAPTIDAPERGRYLYWMIYTPGVIEPAMAEKFSGAEPNRVRNGWGDWPTMLSTLEHALESGPWLLGDWFTAADVMVGSSVVFMQTFGMLPDSATLSSYAARCLERPAYQRAMAFDSPAAD